MNNCMLILRILYVFINYNSYVPRIVFLGWKSQYSFLFLVNPPPSPKSYPSLELSQSPFYICIWQIQITSLSNIPHANSYHHQYCQLPTTLSRRSFRIYIYDIYIQEKPQLENHGGRRQERVEGDLLRAT